MGSIAYIRLVRPVYLLGLALVMLSVRYGLIGPALQVYGYTDPLSFVSFLFIVLAVLLVAAGGFVINDYFDRRDDQVLRSHGLIVGEVLSRRSAISIHITLTVVAFALALVVSVRMGRVQFALLYPVAAGLLWFYSTLYKHRFLVGNVLVALLAFCLPFVLLYYEVVMVEREYWQAIATGALSISGMFDGVLYYSVALGVFVFVLTLLKSLRSFVAGTSLGSNSIAVRLGFKPAKILVSILLFVMVLFLLFWAAYLYFVGSRGGASWYTLFYIVLGIAVPLVASLGVLVFSEDMERLRIAVYCEGVSLLLVVVSPLLRVLL